MDVSEFRELADEFDTRARRIAWCTVATVAPDGAPWTRILHPIWEAATGWIATTRHSLKARHIAHEPRISLTYWDAEQDVVTVHGTASWADDQPTRDRVWALYREPLRRSVTTLPCSGRTRPTRCSACSGSTPPASRSPGWPRR